MRLQLKEDAFMVFGISKDTNQSNQQLGLTASTRHLRHTGDPPIPNYKTPHLPIRMAFQQAQHLQNLE
jgi:hypothetical protein